MFIGKSPRGSVTLIIVVILAGLLTVVGYGLYVAERAVHLQQREDMRVTTQYAAESAANWALAYCRQRGIPQEELQQKLGYPDPQIRTQVRISPRGAHEAIVTGMATGTETDHRIWMRIHQLSTNQSAVEIQVDEVHG